MTDFLINVPIIPIQNKVYGLDSKYNDLYWQLFYFRACGELGLLPSFNEFPETDYNVRFNNYGDLIAVPPFLSQLDNLIKIKKNIILKENSLKKIIWHFIPIIGLSFFVGFWIIQFALNYITLKTGEFQKDILYRSLTSLYSFDNFSTV